MKNRFETTRCLIRPFESDDIDSFMIYRNNEEWMKYQGFKGKSKKEYEESLIIKNDNNNNSSSSIEQLYENGIQLAIILKESLELIGDIYLKKENHSFWIGYTINPNYSRKGYSIEVLNEIINYIKSLSIINSIKAGILKENQASKNLVLKIGFEFLEFDNENNEEIYILKLE